MSSLLSFSFITHFISHIQLGTFEIWRGNDRAPNPVSRPKSVQVAVSRIAEEGEWNEEWFTTWKSRKDNPNKTTETLGAVETSNRTVIKGKVLVEIGSICPVRVKPGERVSRVHTHHTSSLRQSTWKKKYVKGLFL